MKKPLIGKTIVVTRAVEQAEELIAGLNRAGADVIHIPTIEFTEPDSWQACDEAIDNLANVDWVVFTSTNGVRFFCGRLEERNKSAADLNTQEIAAVGTSTDQALKRRGIKVDLVPEEFNAEGLVESFQRIDLSGKTILIPKAQEGRGVLEKGLRATGANVDSVAVYKTQSATTENLTQQINGRKIDLLTFTSPSTFKNFIALFGEQKLTAWQHNGCAFAAIGAVTAAAIAKHNFPVDISPPKSTVVSLVETISEYYN